MSLEQVAHLPVAQQDAFWGWQHAHNPNLDIGYQKHLVQGFRNAAFKNGELLPGVDSAGNGTSLSQGEKANLLTGKAVSGGQKVADAVSTNPADYLVKPTAQADEKAISLAKLGKADPLTLATQDAAINQTRTNDTGVNGQVDALHQYQDVLSQGGLTAIDRARMAQSQQVQQAAAKGQEQAIMADAAEQGRGGGNASLLARLQAQQGATNNIANDDLQTQALALQRRDQAISGEANTGGQIQSAQDAIDQFNTTGERDRARNNLNTINQGKTDTWNENNNRDHANTQTTNQGKILDYATNAGIHTSNANQVNEAQAQNVSPTGGARGMARDIAGGQAALLGQYNGAAGLFAGEQANKDSMDAQQRAALYGLAGSALGGLTSAATSTASWKNL